MVVTTLILANPMQRPSTPARPKCTVVLVNNTLVQQWYDELKKSAPKLRIYQHYNGKSLPPGGLADADVLVTTPHCKHPWDKGTTQLYRLIVDESHLLERQSGVKSWASLGYHFPSTWAKVTNVWCVTGTPFSMHGTIDTQARLIGHDCLRTCLEETGTYDPVTRTISYSRRAPLAQTADVVKRYVIRHTMSQQCGDGDRMPPRSHRAVPSNAPPCLL